MKTASISIISWLRGFTDSFKTYQPHVTNNRAAATHAQTTRKAHIGNFLAGPHGVFDPHLMK